MSTYSVSTTHHSQKLAFLRLLLAKACQRLTGLTLQLRFITNRLGTLAATAANAALAVATTTGGYTAVTSAARTVVSTGWRIVKKVGGWFARAARAVGRTITKAISIVSPKAADTIRTAAHNWVVAPVTQAARTVNTWVSTAGEIAWALSQTPLVRTATVRTAQVISGFLGINALTHGWLASTIVRALPWTMDAIIALTTPWKALAIAAAATAASMGVVLARILASPDNGQEPEPPVAAQPESAARGTADLPETSTQPVALDFDQVAAHVTVEVSADGSIVVHGIPTTVTPEDGRKLADIAAEAAEKHLERILKNRHLPTRDDKRLLTKVAREAIRAKGTTLAADAA